MLARVRSAAVATLAAWVTFCLAAAVVGRTTDDPRFDAAAQEYPPIGAAHWLATAALVSSWVVVICAALPLTVVAARRAWRRRDRVALALFAAPPAGLAVFVGYTALLSQLPDQPVHGGANVAITVSWLALGVIVAALAVGSAAALMRRTEFPPILLRFMGWAVAAVAAAMSLGLLAGAAYGLGVWIEMPALFSSSNGLLQTPLPLTWGALLLVAFAAVITANRAALRVIHVLRTAAAEAARPTA